VERQRRPLWSLVLVGSSLVALALGLAWLGRADHRAAPAAPAPAATGQGPAATALASTPPSTAVAPAVSAAPPTSSPPTTSTVPYAMRAPVALGESVMLGAEPQLEAGGFTVVAEESHQVEWTISVVRQLREDAQVGDTIVIQVGTNGQVTGADLDRLMQLLPAAEVPHVVFLTVHADRAWIGPNNAAIWALPSRYPNVTVLDWDGLVSSGQIAGMAGDGIHLQTDAAKQTYANYIFDVTGHRELIRPVAAP
jgi:hypothetical protein